MLALVNSDNDFKSKLIKWAQKSKLNLRFEHNEPRLEKFEKIYSVSIYIDGNLEATAEGKNKKAAEQKAAEIVCNKLYV